MPTSARTETRSTGRSGSWSRDFGEAGWRSGALLFPGGLAAVVAAEDLHQALAGQQSVIHGRGGAVGVGERGVPGGAELGGGGVAAQVVGAPSAAADAARRG